MPIIICLTNISREQEEIIALTANIKVMEKKITTISKNQNKNPCWGRELVKDTNTKRSNSVKAIPKWRLNTMYKRKQYSPGESITVDNGICPHHHHGPHHQGKQI